MRESDKKKPLRRCCGCMRHLEKEELSRVVRTPDGVVLLDKSGKAAGRGAYVCKDPACLKKLRKSRRLESSLSATVPEEVYTELENINGTEG